MRRGLRFHFYSISGGRRPALNRDPKLGKTLVLDRLERLAFPWKAARRRFDDNTTNDFM